MTNKYTNKNKYIALQYDTKGTLSPDSDFYYF